MLWRAVFALLLLACSSSDETGTSPSSSSSGANSSSGGSTAGPFACDKRDEKSLCADFVTGTTKADAQGSCTGTFLNGVTCSIESAVGTCATTAAGNARAITYYATGGAPFTAASAKTDCTTTFKGTFTSK